MGTFPWAEWDHILKIDPDDPLVSGETFEDVCQTGTDAIEIGGTFGINKHKVQCIIDACAEYDVPLYQEPSKPSVVVHSPKLDGYLIPTVLNSTNPFWMVGAHKKWVQNENDLDWQRTAMEAYIVMNPEAAVAEYTEANCEQSPEEVGAFARVAEKMFGQDIVYVEYAGTLGKPEVVDAAAANLETATLFYGGGIDDYDSAYEMSQYADVIVVGDLVHDEGCEAVRATVEGAKAADAATTFAVRHEQKS